MGSLRIFRIFWIFRDFLNHKTFSFQLILGSLMGFFRIFGIFFCNFVISGIGGIVVIIGIFWDFSVFFGIIKGWIINIRMNILITLS